MKKVEKNIFLFYVIRAFSLPFFWLPILYLYFTQYKGLGVPQTMFLLGLQEFLMIFLEVPTGVIADKVSRKFSVGLGYILTSLPFLFLPLAHSYLIYILIFLVKAIGKALISGADTALLYDTLVDLGRTHEYKKIINRSKVGMLTCSAICIASGGLIAQYNIDLTLILPFPLMLIGAIASFRMIEPETSQKAKLIQESNYLKHTWYSLKYILKSKELFLLALIFSISESLAVNMKWIYTPIFDGLKMSLISIGGITALLYVSKSIMAGLSIKIMSNNSKLNIITAMLVIALLFSAIIVSFNKFTVIIALLGITLVWEIMDVSIGEGIHRHLESHNRATVMSMINLFSSVGATIMINGFGWGQSLMGLNGGLLVLILIFIFGLLGSLFMEKN